MFEVQISEVFGGLILIVMPLIPSFAALLTTSKARRKLQEIILGIAIFVCLFFSYQYVKLNNLNSVEQSQAYSSWFEGFIIAFFSSFKYPLAYFGGICLFYLVLSRIKPPKSK